MKSSANIAGKLLHLTAEEHDELARLLNQAVDNITAAQQIVQRAEYADRALYAGRVMQELLIDPLRAARERTTSSQQRYDCPYPNSAWWGPRFRVA